jgi:hypothetical protein
MDSLSRRSTAAAYGGPPEIGSVRGRSHHGVIAALDDADSVPSRQMRRRGGREQRRQQSGKYDYPDEILFHRSLP